jgi:hypothetical protein
MTLNRRTWPALFIFCLVPAISVAQSGTVSGRVVDETGGALPGVTVLLRTGSDAPTETVSGEDGGYSLTNVPAGRYQLSFMLINFATLTRNDVNVQDGATQVDAVMHCA